MAASFPTELPDFEDGYTRLRALAASYMRRFSESPTLQATALVHEVYLRFAREPRRFADQSHLICTAATAMRQILVDHARARGRLKRGGELRRITLTGLEIPSPADGFDVLLLDDALARLEALDSRQSQIVELRFFVGLSVEEAAQVLGISEKTVKRDWAMARAWLKRELQAPGPHPHRP